MDMNVGKIIGSMRLGNCVISGVGVLAGYAIAQRYAAITPEVGIAMLAAFFITGAGNAINDYFDTETDRKLGKAKIAASEKSILLFFSAILFAIGLGLAANLTAGAFWIATAVSIMLVIYSAILYKMKFLGNIVVALGTALTLIFGAALTPNAYAAGFAALAAFFANVGREIIKDAEDEKGDAGTKKTLPMMMKFTELKKAVFAMYMAAIASGLIAFMLGIFRGANFMILFAASAALFLNSFRLFSANDFSGAQKHSKFGMLSALAAFIAGAL